MRSAIASLLPYNEIVIGKSVSVRKVIVSTQSQILVNNDRGPNAYALLVTNPATPLYIGGPGVTVESGLPIDASQLFKFGMLENTRLYAFALTDLEVYILDMGL